MNVEEFLGRLTFRAWVFDILGHRGPVPLLLDSTKQWSVAIEVVNNASTFCRKEQEKKTDRSCLLCYPEPGS